MTKEQRKEAAKERRKELVSKLSSLNEQQRKELASKLCLLTTCEGHVLTPINTILIHFQNDAGVALTMVGGYDQWRKFNRQVGAGEHGFSIRFPMNPKKSKGDETQDKGDKDCRSMYFGWGTVFDISQTVEIRS